MCEMCEINAERLTKAYSLLQTNCDDEAPPMIISAGVFIHHVM